MEFQWKEIMAPLLTFLGGGAVKTVFDYVTNKRKIASDDNKQRVETAMSIMARETDFAMRISAYNDETVRKYHELQEKYDNKIAECQEKDRIILRLQLDLEKCTDREKRTMPDSDRGRRGRNDMPT